jgi:hypothetical protein
MLIESDSIKPPKSLEELAEYCEVVLSASRYVAATTGKVRNLAILVGNKVSISLPFNHENEEALQRLKIAARSLGCIIYIFDAYVAGDYSLMVLGYTPSVKVHLRTFLKVGPDLRDRRGFRGGVPRPLEEREGHRRGPVRNKNTKEGGKPWLLQVHRSL